MFQGKADCFFKLPGHDCASMAALIAKHMHSVRSGQFSTTAARSFPGAAGKLGEALEFMQAKYTHGHGELASMKVKEYYSTQEVIDDATEYLRDDLQMFGYPELRLDA